MVARGRLISQVALVSLRRSGDQRAYDIAQDLLLVVVLVLWWSREVVVVVVLVEGSRRWWSGAKGFDVLLYLGVVFFP